MISACYLAALGAVMAGLMDEKNRDDTSMREHDIERIWHGETAPEEPGDQQPPTEPTLAERLEQPISRRDLLRGRIPREA